MPTLQQKWIEYRNACFPQGVSGVQEKECRQAFFAGAFSFFNIMSNNIALLDDDPAAHELEKLRKEAHGVLAEYTVSNFAKGN